MKKLNILCVSTYFKGEDFIKGAAAVGSNVYLLTLEKLKDENWPRECLKDLLLIPEWNLEHVKNGLAYRFRKVKFDRFVALDDFDVEKVAELRECFRMPGMGATTARYFRDKLAMRIKAKEAKIPVPAFTPLFNDDEVNIFTESVDPPWLIKPRSDASATGIKKIQSKEELWDIVNSLGDERHNYLLEKFAPGEVFHVDGLNFNGRVVFSRVSQYLQPPFDVAHGGGVFRSVVSDFGGEDDKCLTSFNKKVMTAFGMKYSASHTEFIKCKMTGEYFFLETSSRVGGANLAEMVQYSSHINLWREWAKVESATLRGESYKIPKVKKLYTGILVSLSRHEYPDYNIFKDKEIVWTMSKPWHVGLILQSKSRERILELLEKYTKVITVDLHASLPAKEVGEE